MRVINSLELVYLDADIRIQRGPTSWFVWRKVPSSSPSASSSSS